jgi:hypothetical protein
MLFHNTGARFENVSVQSGFVFRNLYSARGQSGSRAARRRAEARACHHKAGDQEQRGTHGRR